LVIMLLFLNARFFFFFFLPLQKKFIVIHYKNNILHKADSGTHCMIAGYFRLVFF